ncbi:sodium-dependent bicarbonate transport family permease [Variovorax sp. PCZ-1]|uniref:sodium-dependent bicarbonate transport family permease n=1 Tax=Variovorax sp. PCZ-1 TaxID=2835533 RepID=UPI001BCD679E|nr:sodium-dependent bicarbonate transport family permease [Variovorax sp. PCZ-1]MBS7806038.1 sodium-dependent bicarbonate transport family permease [Variovorax sp. PCZ-1]
MIDAVVLFFILGVIARLGKSDLKLPQALYEALSVYLLLAIGLKGGIELHKQSLAAVLPQILACMALGALIPVLMTPVLKRMGFSGVDSAVLAAHYGSVSVVTFAVASSYLQRQGVAFEAHAALWVAVMEAPGIVAGVFLARRELNRAKALEGKSVEAKGNWRELAHEVLFGKSVLLLVGGLIIGAVMGEQGLAPIAPLFTDLFKGVLALFLLELGLVAGAQLPEVKRYGLRLLAVGIVSPLILSLMGAALGKALGLSTGGIAILATLAASASYIAAPTAMRMAVPQGNAGLSIAAALGISFPFNIVVGVPLYTWLAQKLA